MPTPQPTHTAALVHETPLIRTALARLLHDLGNYRLVADEPDPPGLKRALALGPPPNVVLVSLEWAQAQGFTFLNWLATHRAEARVLVVGREPDDRAMLHLLVAGAHGFCCTRHGLDRLCTILDHVCAGALHFPAQVQAKLRTLLPRPTDEVPDIRDLTERQITFLRLLAGPGDLSYPQIAKRMGVQPCSAHKYRNKLFKRYGINSKAGLVKLALSLGLAS